MSVPRSRIFELLELHVLEKEPMFIRMRIFKAMEQYGKEQYVKGCRVTNNKHELTLSDAGVVASENIRLRSLVQAQKELIYALNDQVDADNVSWEYRDKIIGLYNKIQQLEA